MLAKLAVVGWTAEEVVSEHGAVYAVEEAVCVLHELVIALYTEVT